MKQTTTSQPNQANTLMLETLTPEQMQAYKDGREDGRNDHATGKHYCNIDPSGVETDWWDICYHAGYNAGFYS